MANRLDRAFLDLLDHPKRFSQVRHEAFNPLANFSLRACNHIFFDFLDGVLAVEALA